MGNGVVASGGVWREGPFARSHQAPTSCEVPAFPHPPTHPPPRNGTSVYATSWAADAVDNDVIYPMAWDTTNRAIPGIDRTAYYQSSCAAC